MTNPFPLHHDPTPAQQHARDQAQDSAQLHGLARVTWLADYEVPGRICPKCGGQMYRPWTITFCMAKGCGWVDLAEKEKIKCKS